MSGDPVAFSNTSAVDICSCVYLITYQALHSPTFRPHALPQSRIYLCKVDFTFSIHQISLSFTGLMKYRNKSFWEGHKTITFDTLTDRHQYEVIAVFKTVVYTDSSDSFKYYEFTDAENASEFDAYVAKCKELSLYDTGVSAEYGDKLISLSTCEYSRNNGRLVVVAKRVD